MAGWNLVSQNVSFKWFSKLSSPTKSSTYCLFLQTETVRVQAVFTGLSLGGMAGCNPSPSGALQGWFSLAMSVQFAMVCALSQVS